MVDQSHRRPSQFPFSRTKGRQKAGTPTTQIFFALTLSKLFDIQIRVGPALHYFSQRSLLPLKDSPSTLSFVSSSMFLAVAREIALNPDIGFTAALTHTTRACPHALAPPNRLEESKRGINATMSAVIPNMHKWGRGLGKWNRGRKHTLGYTKTLLKLRITENY